MDILFYFNLIFMWSIYVNKYEWKLFMDIAFLMSVIQPKWFLGKFFSDLEINVCYKNNFEMLEKLLIFQN